jgi:hypothetical protein
MAVYIAKTTGPVEKPGILYGKRTAYFTKNGITVFFFDEFIPAESSSCAGIEDAIPGMIGIDFSGSSLYLILANGECERLTVLDDHKARDIIHATNHKNEEIVGLAD